MKYTVFFLVHSSFKFYLSNEASNELLPKTKVVDLEILNNFGIQEFFFEAKKKEKNWVYKLDFRNSS